MKFLASLLPGTEVESRKSQALILAAVFTVMGRWLGLPDESLQAVMVLAIGYMGSQGLADFGKAKASA